MTKNEFCLTIFILGLILVCMTVFTQLLENKIDKLQKSLDTVESQLTEFGRLEIKQ
jgi:hypothetical protein